jgi:tRNA pseudouridine32 synthase/23S rRNA pseudouridine746 synthase
MHLNAIGSTIVNDPTYPELQPPKAGFDRPMQLLACRLAFRDPATGRERDIESRLTLTLWPASQPPR